MTGLIIAAAIPVVAYLLVFPYLHRTGGPYLKVGLRWPFVEIVDD